MPSPADSCCHVGGHVHQRGQHAFADGRYGELAQFKAEAADEVGLLDLGLALIEQGGLGVMVSKLLGLATQLVAFEGLRERHETRRPGLERAAAAERVGLVGDPAARVNSVSAL